MESNSIKEELYNLNPIERLNIQLSENQTLDEQVKSILHPLKEDIFYHRLKQFIWKEITTNQDVNDINNFKRIISNTLDQYQAKEVFANVGTNIYESKLHTSVKMTSFRKDLLKTKSVEDEKLDYIKQARSAWEQGVIEELRAIIFEAKRPFLLTRETGQKNPYLDESITTNNETNQKEIKFLYDSEDLMETVINIKNPNLRPSFAERSIGLITSCVWNLRGVSLYDYYVRKYAELQISYSQLGIDDLHFTPLLPPPPGVSGLASPLGSIANNKILVQRQDESEFVNFSGTTIQARQLLRRGVPLSQRCKIWRIACGLPEKATLAEEHSFNRLKYYVNKYDFVTDELFMHDLQTILDDPRFFVFEEELKEIILAFSRDPSIHNQTNYEIHAPLTQAMGVDFSNDTTAPPSGVQPFLGFATYFAPLCYIFKQIPSLYSISKYLYCHIWCKLNVLSYDEGCLLSVCKHFEVLLMESCPRLFLHMTKIGVPPLKVAFPWIQLGFVGILETDQILFLWERMIGYQDPGILAVASVAILIHRAEMLFRCQSEAEAMMVLAEGSRLHILTLIQTYLMKEGKN